MPDSRMLRPVRVRHYASIMGARGVALGALLADTGIDASSLHSPDYLIRSDQVRAVIRNVLALSRDPAIGFEMGLKTDLSGLGVLAGALLSCQRVAQTLEVWSRYSEPVAGMISRLAVDWTADGHLVLDVIDLDVSSEIRQFCAEELLGLIKGLGETESGVSPEFLSAEFGYPRPAHAGIYQRLLECPIRFDKPRTQVQMSGGWARRPVISTDQELSGLCLDRCNQILEKLRGETGATSVAQRIREQVLLNPRKVLDLNQAAGHLHMSTRTLKRRLQGEGTTFQATVRQCRINLAGDYLRAGRIPLREVADLLGFSDERAFRRAFKSWTGDSPNERREGTTVTQEAG